MPGTIVSRLDWYAAGASASPQGTTHDHQYAHQSSQQGDADPDRAEVGTGFGSESQSPPSQDGEAQAAIECPLSVTHWTAGLVDPERPVEQVAAEIGPGQEQEPYHPATTSVIRHDDSSP